MYKALYGNAMLESLSGTPIWPPDTNMQKHLFSSFSTNA